MMSLSLLHFANVLYLLSYSVRDILWLRLLTIVAMLLLGGYYLATQQMAPVLWQSAFLAINLFHVGLLLHERRPIELTEQERRLHQTALKPLTALQVRRLNSHWLWCQDSAGAVILPEGVHNDGLRLLVEGQANVSVAGKTIATLNAYQFFGEMSFLTNNVTTATIIATTPVRYALLSEQVLQELTKRDADFRTALQSAIGNDLVRKLLNERLES
ncbi:MAG: cyclic nucleotide-binding domain-containing protein [Pirellulaceae bacterium]|nr:cyclic nucleotide-binding domain-containing protein [Pirellulaceae bacterium]